MGAVHALMQEVEGVLAASYSFNLVTSATECLVSPQVAAQIEQRGAVLVYQEPGGDELELGVYLSRDVQEHLEQANPLDGITIDNLDAFCVLIEEISHFHLIANRARHQQGVSRLELEWQGEIDKVLLVGTFLLKQTGSPCFHQLAHLIFDKSHCTSSEHGLYDEALRYAAQHWYRLLSNIHGLTAEKQWQRARQQFRRTYHLQWSAKLWQLNRHGSLEGEPRG